jgi:hypothetical protein
MEIRISLHTREMLIQNHHFWLSSCLLPRKEPPSASLQGSTMAGMAGSTSATIPVIVDLGKKGEKATYVFATNIKEMYSADPTYYVHAVVQQCPELECALVKLYQGFTKCNISMEEDAERFKTLFSVNMKEAIDWQNAKGSKALYRKIRFTNR